MICFLINSGKLFHTKGPTNEIAFCPTFVFQKGILSFANIFHVSILQCGANSKKNFQIIRTSAIDKCECNSVYTLTLLLVGNQFIHLKSSSDM